MDVVGLQFSGVCVCFGILCLLATRYALLLGVFLFWENEVFLTKVNELEGKFYLETSVVHAKYPKLNYRIYIFS